MSDSLPALLKELEKWPPNRIYTMATPREIAQAARLFSEELVTGFRWGASGRLLQVDLDMLTSPRALVSCGKRGLEAVCDCGRDLSHPCPHLLAVIMTLLRVLRGSRFHHDDLSPATLELLKQQLAAGEAEKAPDLVVFSSHRRKGRCDIDLELEKGGPSWRIDGPPKGMEWLAWQEDQPEQVGAAFLKWLGKKPETMKVLLRLGSENFRVEDESPAVLVARIRLQRDKKGLRVVRVLQDESGETVSSFTSLGYGLAFDHDKKRMVGITPADAWAGMEALGVVHHDQFLEPEVFNLQGVAPSGDYEFLDASGTPVEPVAFSPNGLIRITTGGDAVTLSIRLASREGVLMPGHEVFANRLGELAVDGWFAPLLKSRRRREHLGELLAKLAVHESEQNKETWSSIAADPVFESAQMYGDDAVKCLQHVVAHLRSWDPPRVLAQADQPDQPWVVVEGRGTVLSRVWAVVRNIFPDIDLIRSKDLGFEIEPGRLTRALPRLAALCRGEKVLLQLNGGPVRSVNLKVSVRAVATGDIDWFDLHPEVRAGQLRLPPEQWRELLDHGGFRTDEGEFVVADEDSMLKLAEVDALAGENQKTNRAGLLNWMALRERGVECVLPVDDEEVLQALVRLKQIPASKVPKMLQGEMRDYQRHGYDWLAFLYQHRFGGCLADDMGLGKTLQTLALLAAIKEGLLTGEGRPHLVVLPPTLLFNWENEIRRFAPDLKIHDYTGSNRSLDFHGADVVLTTYELVRRDIDELSRLRFDAAVFDEAQTVKNPLSRRAQALKKIQARFRLCLTGTPLENHAGEFHSIMEAALPGLFGDRKKFLEDVENEGRIMARSRPFLLRRTKDKILSELPPKIESDAWLALGEVQKECYTRAVGEVRREVLEAYKNQPSQQAGIAALAALMRLRQICISPAMISPKLGAESPKLDYLVEQLGEVLDEGHSALVFSQFVKALDLTAEALTRAGLSFLRMDGSTPAKQRKSLVAGFQEGKEPSVFLISTRTGGTGLNLTRAGYVYHLDPWWNPAVENQATDRAHRIGQNQSVYVQRLLMRHSIEEKMMILKERKKALFQTVVEGSQSAGARGKAMLTADDFKFLTEVEK